jgi:hypothetical protein
MAFPGRVAQPKSNQQESPFGLPAVLLFIDAGQFIGTAVFLL